MAKVFFRSDYYTSKPLNYAYDGTNLLDIIDEVATGFGGISEKKYQYTVLSTAKPDDNFSEFVISTSEEITDIGELSTLTLTGILSGDFRVKEKNRTTIRLIDDKRLIDLMDGVKRIDEVGECFVTNGGWQHIHKDATHLVIKSPKGLHFLFSHKWFDTGVIANNSLSDFTKTSIVTKTQQNLICNCVTQIIMLSDWDSSLSVSENYRAYAIRGNGVSGYPSAFIKPYTSNGNFATEYKGWWLSVTDDAISWGFDYGVVQNTRNRFFSIGTTKDVFHYIIGCGHNEVSLDYNNLVNSGVTFYYNNIYQLNHRNMYFSENNTMVVNGENGLCYMKGISSNIKMTTESLITSHTPFMINDNVKTVKVLDNIRLTYTFPTPQANLSFDRVTQIDDKFYIASGACVGYFATYNSGSLPYWVFLIEI